MKIKNTKRLDEKIFEYYLKNEVIFATQDLASKIETEGIVFDSPCEVKECAEDFKKCMLENNTFYSDDECLMGAMLCAVLEEMPKDITCKILGVVLHNIVKSSRVLHKGAFEDNPYCKNIHFNGEKSGRFQLANDKFDPYELFIYDETKEIDGITIPQFAVFDHKFSFPALREGDLTWMTVSPCEINTMQPSIDAARGNVLVLGLGLGYWPYMASRKPEVEHITIVEKEADVIELFKKHILPQFENKEKITIIQADAHDYINVVPDGKYDYCFADIWTGNTDTTSYIKLKFSCRRFEKMKVSYWIEESLIQSILSTAFFVISDEYFRTAGYSDSEEGEWLDSQISDDDRFAIDFLTYRLKNAVIERPAQFDYYMNPENIKQLICNV